MTLDRALHQSLIERKIDRGELLIRRSRAPAAGAGSGSPRAWVLSFNFKGIIRSKR